MQVAVEQGTRPLKPWRPAKMPAAAELERCACPICGADKPAPTSFGEPPFAVVRCGECAAHYLSPRLKESAIRGRYGVTYFEGGEGGYASYVRQAASLRATFRRLLENLAQRGFTGGSVLDVGCGYGYFLAEARVHFRHRAGTELSPAAARLAAIQADKVYDGGIETVPSDARFDCITALHVLEHVYDPRAFLEQLRQRLKPGGGVAIAAPDMAGMWRKVLGRRWPSWKFPEHVSFFDADSLTALLRKSGFTDIEPLPYPHAFPLSDVLQKLGGPSFDSLSMIKLWIPGTTVAVSARRT